MKDYDVPLNHDNGLESEMDEGRQCSSDDDPDGQVLPDSYVAEDHNDEHQIWDGSEAEFIADDDALIYEEPQTGIKIEYTLKYEEVISFLKSFSQYQKERKKIKIASWILSFLSAMFLLLFLARALISALVFAAVCAGVVLLLVTLPTYFLNSSARTLNSRESVYVEIYPDNVVVGKGGREVEIPLDGTCEYLEFENLFILFPPKGEMIIIPIRAVEPDFLPDVQAMLIAGTVPRDVQS